MEIPRYKEASVPTYGERVQDMYQKNVLKHMGRETLLGRAINKVTDIPYRMAAFPVNATMETGGTLLAGRRAKRGPMKGKRLVEIPGGPGRGLEEISHAEWRAIKNGKIPGKAYKGVIGMRPYFYKRRYGAGGLIGLARKHPVLVGGAGLLGLYLAMKKDNPEEPGEGQLAQLLSMSPEVRQRYYGGGDEERQNPLGAQVWG